MIALYIQKLYRLALFIAILTQIALIIIDGQTAFRPTILQLPQTKMYVCMCVCMYV